MLLFKLATHPVNSVDTADRTDFGCVVDEADVSFCGGVKLPDLDVPETVEKLQPNVCSNAVADSNPHPVVFFVVHLWSDMTSKSELRSLIQPEPVWKSRYLGCVAEVAQGFADVLHHRHVVLPAVLPELRGRELPP